MGDLLLAIPAISRLQARYPQAKLDIVVGAWNVKTAQMLGVFENVFVFDFFSKKSVESPKRRKAEFKSLLGKLDHYDIAIDLRRQADTRFALARISHGGTV